MRTSRSRAVCDAVSTSPGIDRNSWRRRSRSAAIGGARVTITTDSFSVGLGRLRHAVHFGVARKLKCGQHTAVAQPRGTRGDGQLRHHAASPGNAVERGDLFGGMTALGVEEMN